MQSHKKDENQDDDAAEVKPVVKKAKTGWAALLNKDKQQAIPQESTTLNQEQQREIGFDAGDETPRSFIYKANINKGFDL